ncbi:DUF2497 domain-containing protein [Daeguia caeni]|uniref:DUF2497 domain-containing protein n=1 Tax=Daeguia caeni TaxID=439612 RepID=A0ABV9HA38_9HYPH
MAQISSAAREPSMEEILASIRRIIEDSDVVRHPVTENMAAPAHATVSELRRSSAEEKRSISEDRQGVEALNVPETVSTVPAEMEASAEVPAVSVAIEEESCAASISEMIAAEADEIHEAEEEGMDVPQAALATHEPVAATADSEPVTAAPEVEEAEEMAMTEEDAGRILSQATARHVSAVFQDLNHAVHSGPRRSFDEIASDVLRPMLQDWLDKNLPELVERLVREEIERIVQGAR